MNNRMQLMDGVYLRAIQTDQYKTGCFSVNFLRPLRAEEAAKNALLPAVLLRGTRKHPDMTAISMLLDELYGATMGTLVRKKGEVQSWGFYGDFIEDDYTLGGENIFGELCAFLRELLFEPVLEGGLFRQEFVEGEKSNLINTIESRINDKRTYALSQLMREMCEGEAYAVPRLGTEETVSEITKESLYRHYRETLAHSQVEIFYLGKKSPEEVERQMRQVLSDLPRGRLVSFSTELRSRVSQVKERTEVLDVTQGKLVLGYRTGVTVCSPAYPALLLCNAIFGGCVTSKLFMNVREKLSLCYYAGSSLEIFKGLMFVSCGVDFENEQKARTEILRQLDDCREGRITEEEFQAAQAFVRSSLKAGKDSPGRIDDFSLGQTIAGLSGTMEQLEQAVAAVTMEDVVAAAGRLQLDTVYFLKGAEK